MDQADAPRLSAALKRLCGVFGRPFTKELLEGYLAALVDVPIDQVELNAITALRTGERMPVPRDLRAGDEESDEERAGHAWNVVRACISSRDTPSDEIAQGIVAQLGGWRSLGNQNAEEIGTWTRKEFVRLYVERLRHDERQAARKAVRATQGAKALEGHP